MNSSSLQQAVAAVPPGPWAVGVSGGADSVALLLLLHARHDLQLRIAHLDHETRAGQSAEDARFVHTLAAKLALPFSTVHRSEIEAHAQSLPANLSARYRAARFVFFRRVVAEHALQGVLLAHHQADQAETILQRLLRGSGPLGLTGIRPRAIVGGVTVVRPLLEVPPAWLRDFLRERGQEWREDASNASPVYLRNRLRPLLKNLPDLQSSLLEVASANRALQDWIDASAPTLSAVFAASDLTAWPDVLARPAARAWLLSHGVSPDQISAADLARLLEMANDAASAARQDFPGPLTVRRRAKRIFIDPRP